MASNEIRNRFDMPRRSMSLNRPLRTFYGGFQHVTGELDRHSSPSLLSTRPRSLSKVTSFLPRGIGSRLYQEFRITYLVVCENATICLLPTTMFTVTASLRTQLSYLGFARAIGSALWLGFLMNYVIDSSNQIQGVEEDKLNKPFRPIPAGLTDTQGLFRRFLIAQLIYTLSGWWLGVLPWVLFWQTVVVVELVYSTPGAYVFWKTPFNACGSFTQLLTGWNLVAPLDRTAWTWILFMSLYMPLPLIFEDLRDVKGDSLVGRRTPASVFGERPIRYWFAAFTFALPLVVFFLLAEPSGAPIHRQMLGIGLIALFAWSCMLRALFLRDHKSDRGTYQLFCFTWGMVIGLSVFLSWP